METAAAPSRPGWRRPVFVAAFVAFIGVWTFAFWYDANRPVPEPLDAASQRSAAAACRSAISRLSAQGPVPAPTDVEGRIARIRSDDAVFEDLVVAFAAIHPTDHAGADALKGFATDWKNLTAARERYADALQSGEQRPDLVIPVDPSKAPITIRMKEYAEIHRLTACVPESLQAEVVEGPREYPSPPSGSP